MNGNGLRVYKEVAIINANVIFSSCTERLIVKVKVWLGNDILVCFRNFKTFFEIIVVLYKKEYKIIPTFS